MLGALTGGPSLKEVSFLNEPMPKEADDFLRERSDEIRVDSRTTQIMVIIYYPYCFVYIRTSAQPCVEF